MNNKPRVIFSGEVEYYPHRYKGRNPSRCHVEIITGDGVTLVIATELASNPGMSITNSSEYLATYLVGRFALNAPTTVFVEHYNDETSYGVASFAGAHNHDRYSIVTYRWVNNVASHPEWTSITEARFAKLKSGKREVQDDER